MKLLNVSIQSYLGLPEDERLRYDFAIRFGKNITEGRDFFIIGDPKELKFGTIKTMQMLFAGDFDLGKMLGLLADVVGANISELVKFGVFDIMQQLHYLRRQIDNINTLEANSLASPMNPIHEAAGVKRFNKFGAMLQVDSLANGKVWKYEEVEGLKYNICFSKLLLMKDTVDFENAIDRLNRRKNT